MLSSTTPLFRRQPDIFLLPHIPLLNWATLLISTLIVIDVSTVIADYHVCISRSISSQYNNATATTTTTKQKQKQHKANKLVNIAALQITIFSLLIIFLSTHLVTHLTRGIDGRMIYVLEGISRLEASHLMAYISYKTPRWIGMYHSPSVDRHQLMMKHVELLGQNTTTTNGGGEQDEEEDALKFHVRYTIGQYFVCVWCLLLPQ